MDIAVEPAADVRIAPSTSAPVSPGPAAVPPPQSPSKQSPLTPTPARQRVSDLIRKAADAGPTDSSKPKPTAPPTTEPSKTNATAATSPQDAPKSGEATSTPTDAKTSPEAPQTSRGKQSPWKLLDTYKAKLTETERLLAEAKKQTPDPTQMKTLMERAEQAEARMKELEEEMRYIDYSKTREYHDSYQKPLEDAWSMAMSDMRELTVTGEDGVVRQATAQDLLALANMPLKEAREAAKEWFGEAADDVMAHRKTIRELDNKQQQALANARKQGSERQQQRAAAVQKMRQEVRELWAQLKEEHAQKYDFLKPKEGDDEWNSRLEKATKFVDTAFADMAKINDLRLTAEERADIVRRHVALRNRAIGFSTYKALNKQLQARVAELEKQLSEYKGGEPKAGDTRPAPDSPTAVATDRMEAIKQRMRELAK